jgi:hypothetical protein
MLTDFAAFCLTDLWTGDTFTHGLYFDPACELLIAPMEEGAILYLCTVDHILQEFYTLFLNLQNYFTTPNKNGQ